VVVVGAHDDVLVGRVGARDDGEDVRAAGDRLQVGRVAGGGGVEAAGDRLELLDEIGARQCRARRAVVAALQAVLAELGDVDDGAAGQQRRGPRSRPGRGSPLMSGDLNRGASAREGQFGQPLADRRRDRVEVGAQAVVGRDLDDAPALAGGRHPEAIALALHHEHRDLDRVELVLATGGRRAAERPGGCSGKARHRTPTAPVAAAVRQATRAPDERPPVTKARPDSSSPDSASRTAVQAASSSAARGVERRPATR
jgi:hypothetical protein